MATYWTDEEVAALRQMCRDGLTDGEMASRLPGRTSGSVCGKRMALNIKRVGENAAVNKNIPYSLRRPALYDEFLENERRHIQAIIDFGGFPRAFERERILAELGRRRAA